MKNTSYECVLDLVQHKIVRL